MWKEKIEEDLTESFDTIKENYEKLTPIAIDILRYAKINLKVGTKALDYAESIEKRILEHHNCELAFPVNISINEIAAHSTPSYEDPTVFDENMVVKVDIGICLNGYIADFAFTKDFSKKNQDLLESCANALTKAVEICKEGTKTNDIGKIIESSIKEKGFKPISNLTGHLIKKYNLHAGISIPNIASEGMNSYELKAGNVFAIEPFASKGNGYVEDKEVIEIFSLDNVINPRMRHTREVLEYIKKNHAKLPFAERHLYKKFNSRIIVSTAVRELLMNGSLYPYPVLADSDIVSQFETTIIVDKNECIEVVPVDEIIN
ncbi:MAG: type II methionyl aminopeptidase [Candidatus Micrarchaeota archaeon]|nr:type II methionyl aminopeptidase [Candidatus Micrarchaeota archaeon]